MTTPAQLHDSQLLRGVLPMLILTLLEEQESYGYELVERLRTLGLTGLATGVVYPVLGRFERDKLLTSQLVPSSAGPARRYYTITESGRLARADAVEKWRAIATIAERGLAREEHIDEA